MEQEIKKWRPDKWINGISFQEVSQISPRLVSMMTIKEKKLYEAGADAILEALSKLRMNEVVRIIDGLRIEKLKE